MLQHVWGNVGEVVRLRIPNCLTRLIEHRGSDVGKLGAWMGGSTTVELNLAWFLESLSVLGCWPMEL